MGVRPDNQPLVRAGLGGDELVWEELGVRRVTLGESRSWLEFPLRNPNQGRG